MPRKSDKPREKSRLSQVREGSEDLATEHIRLQSKLEILQIHIEQLEQAYSSDELLQHSFADIMTIYVNPLIELNEKKVANIINLAKVYNRNSDPLIQDGSTVALQTLLTAFLKEYAEFDESSKALDTLCRSSDQDNPDHEKLIRLLMQEKRARINLCKKLAIALETQAQNSSALDHDTHIKIDLVYQAAEPIYAQPSELRAEDTLTGAHSSHAESPRHVYQNIQGSDYENIDGESMPFYANPSKAFFAHRKQSSGSTSPESSMYGDPAEPGASAAKDSSHKSTTYGELPVESPWKQRPRLTRHDQPSEGNPGGTL